MTDSPRSGSRCCCRRDRVRRELGHPHDPPLWHRNDFPKMPNEDSCSTPSGRSASRGRLHWSPALRPGRCARRICRKKSKRPGHGAHRDAQRHAVDGPKPGALVCLLRGRGVLLSVRCPGARCRPARRYLRVFQLVGATAFIGYSMALWQMSIWYSRAWSMTIKAYGGRVDSTPC